MSWSWCSSNPWVGAGHEPVTSSMFYMGWNKWEQGKINEGCPMQSSSKIGQTSNIDKLNKPVLLTPGHCQFFGVPHNTDIAFAIAFLHTIEAFFSFLLACLLEQINTKVTRKPRLPPSCKERWAGFSVLNYFIRRFEKLFEKLWPTCMSVTLVVFIELRPSTRRDDVRVTYDYCPNLGTIEASAQSRTQMGTWLQLDWPRFHGPGAC